MAESSLAQVLVEVRNERARQDAKWGKQNHDPFLYLAILGEEYGEACQAALEYRFGEHDEFPMRHLREELIQTAAVAVAAVECLDRQKWEWGGHRRVPRPEPQP